MTIPAVHREAGVDAQDVIGLGTDFTACTMLPIDEAGTPLCQKPEWRDNPYAWVKIWNHHTAQPEANRCHMVLGSDDQIVPGMCGVVEDGVVPGFYGFEAG